MLGSFSSLLGHLDTCDLHYFKFIHSLITVAKNKVLDSLKKKKQFCFHWF